jgi:uncharacterized membrane protein
MLGNLLRAGVLVSASIAAIAGIFYLFQHRADPVGYATFRLERSSLRSVPGILRSAMQLQSYAIIQLGLLLLIATPIMRVALAGVGFYLEKDRLYVVVSVIILAVLLFSVMHAV